MICWAKHIKVRGNESKKFELLFCNLSIMSILLNFDVSNDPTMILAQIKQKKFLDFAGNLEFKSVLIATEISKMNSSMSFGSRKNANLSTFSEIRNFKVRSTMYDRAVHLKQNIVSLAKVKNLGIVF